MKHPLRAVIACCAVALVAWVCWGVYTVDHAEEPVTFGYAFASAASVLGPLVVALIILARAA